jgi:hypothetical protein
MWPKIGIRLLEGEAQSCCLLTERKTQYDQVLRRHECRFDPDSCRDAGIGQIDPQDLTTIEWSSTPAVCQLRCSPAFRLYTATAVCSLSFRISCEEFMQCGMQYDRIILGVSIPFMSLSLIYLGLPPPPHLRLFRPSGRFTKGFPIKMQNALLLSSFVWDIRSRKLVGSEWLASRSACLIPKKEPTVPITKRVDGSRSRAGPGAQEKNPSSCLESPPGRPDRSYPLQADDRAILAHDDNDDSNNDS